MRRIKHFSLGDKRNAAEGTHRQSVFGSFRVINANIGIRGNLGSGYRSTTRLCFAAFVPLFLFVSYYFYTLSFGSIQPPSLRCCTQHLHQHRLVQYTKVLRSWKTKSAANQSLRHQPSFGITRVGNRSSPIATRPHGLPL